MTSKFLNGCNDAKKASHSFSHNKETKCQLYCNLAKSSSYKCFHLSSYRFFNKSKIKGKTGLNHIYVTKFNLSKKTFAAIFCYSESRAKSISSD